MRLGTKAEEGSTSTELKIDQETTPRHNAETGKTRKITRYKAVFNLPQIHCPAVRVQKNRPALIPDFTRTKARAFTLSQGNSLRMSLIVARY